MKAFIVQFERYCFIWHILVISLSATGWIVKGPLSLREREEQKLWIELSEPPCEHSSVVNLNFLTDFFRKTLFWEHPAPRLSVSFLTYLLFSTVNLKILLPYGKLERKDFN